MSTGERRLTFRARIEIVGVNPFVWLSGRQAALLAPGRRGPIPVRFQVDGAPPDPSRVNLMPARDGRYRLYLNGTVRRTSGSKVGDRVGVAVAFDAAYRKGPADPMPSAFRSGLSRDPTAASRWRKLPPSRQKEVLRYLARLRGPAAREENIAKALRVLGGSTERFLGRQWNPRTT